MTSQRLKNAELNRWIRRLVSGQTGLYAGLLLAVSVLLALAGPFGTFGRGDFLHRLVYWSVLCVVSLGIAITTKHLITNFLPNLAKIFSEAATIILTTIIFTPFLRWWSSEAYPEFDRYAPDVLQMAGQVLVICMAISVLSHGMQLLFAGQGAPQEAVRPSVRLARRLSEGFEGDIFRLSAEGHTVLVYTDQSLFRVRMRLTDAIEEMTGVDGHCTHRSHWVATQAVTGSGRKGGKPHVTLRDGSQVPVSRKYQPDLEGAGLL